MLVNQISNFKRTFKFIYEQALFSLSSFIFLRNLLKNLDFKTAGQVGIYFVTTFALLTIIRPLSLKIFSETFNHENQPRTLSPEIEFLSRLKNLLFTAGLILSSIGFTVDVSGQIYILLPMLGVLFILNDILRTRNIVDGNPEENQTGNIIVLLFSLASFCKVSQTNQFSVIYLWIVSQIFFLIFLLKSQKKFHKNSRSQPFDFTRIGNVLSLEGLITQGLGFLFIFWLTQLNPDFSGQFRVANSAFTSIPILLFSALASPYSIQISVGNVQVREQILRLSLSFATFFTVYLIAIRIGIFGLLLAGRETKTFENGIAPAFVVATLVTLISHITHSYAKILSGVSFMCARIFPIAILYALILIFLPILPRLEFERLLWGYLLLTYIFVVVILRRYGSGHDVIS